MLDLGKHWKSVEIKQRIDHTKVIKISRGLLSSLFLSFSKKASVHKIYT